MKVYAFIFARAGSKQIKNKNLKKINGKPLILYSLNLAKKIKIIKKIFVSTDSREISNLAKKHGAQIIQRPKHLATDKSNELDSWKHAINELNKKKDFFDIFLSLPCTSPLRAKADVLNSIKKFNKKKFDILVNITESSRNPFFNMVKKNKKNILNLVINKKKKYFRRQDVPKIFNLTTLAYVTTPNYILKTKNILDGRVFGNIVPQKRAIDIDSDFDLDIAKLLLKR